MIDGMAVIQEVADRVPSTIGALSLFILHHILSIAVHFEASRVDFVCDRYFATSIKNAERLRRTGGAQQRHQRALSSNQKTPQQFRTFLQSSENKESLCLFLATHWSSLSNTELRGKSLYASLGDKCLRLTADTETTAINTIEVPELTSDHEEADTRLFLHSEHASASTNSVVIKSPDTDTFILGVSVAAQKQDGCKLYLCTGLGSTSSRLLDLNAVASRYGPCTMEALLGFHAFTGCDSTSSFKGKGKLKPLHLMMQSPRFLSTFKDLGQSWNLTSQQYRDLEVFVCSMYGQKTDSVDQARHGLFCLTGKCDFTLPPNRDSLVLHSQRANYQAAIWRRSLVARQYAPSPVGHGWKLSGSDDSPWLAVQWTSTTHTSSITELVKCGCTKDCSTKRCSCKSSELPCTQLCQCENCENKSTFSVEGSVVHESDTDSENE